MASLAAQLTSAKQDLANEKTALKSAEEQLAKLLREKAELEARLATASSEKPPIAPSAPPQSSKPAPSNPGPPPGIPQQAEPAPHMQRQFNAWANHKETGVTNSYFSPGANFYPPQHPGMPPQRKGNPSQSQFDFPQMVGPMPPSLASRTFHGPLGGVGLKQSGPGLHAPMGHLENPLQGPPGMMGGAQGGMYPGGINGSGVPAYGGGGGGGGKWGEAKPGAWGRQGGQKEQGRGNGGEPSGDDFPHLALINGLLDG